MSLAEATNEASNNAGITATGATLPETYKFEFDGKWTELLLIMLKNIVLTVFTLGIYNFWGRTNTRRYLWQHFKFNRRNKS